MTQKPPKYIIEGKQTNGAVPATKECSYNKISSPVGKNAVAAVKATTHAFGFIN